MIVILNAPPLQDLAQVQRRGLGGEVNAPPLQDLAQAQRRGLGGEVNALNPGSGWFPINTRSVF